MTDLNSRAAQEAELARLIVTTLNLEVQPSDIDPDAPLYQEGLGLDSIDMLEIALAVSTDFGVELRADDANFVWARDEAVARILVVDDAHVQLAVLKLRER